MIYLYIGIWLLIGALHVFLIELLDGPLDDPGHYGFSIVMFFSGPLLWFVIIPEYITELARRLRRN